MCLDVTVTIHPGAKDRPPLWALRLVLSPELLGRGVACPPGLQWEPAPSQQSPGTSDAASGVSPEVPQTGRQYVIDDRELPARGLVLQL